MNINKNSWHYKVWKEFTDHKSYQGEANFCEYTRTIFIKAPACCLLVLVLGSLIVIGQILIAPFVIPFGWRPVGPAFFKESNSDFIVRYEGIRIWRGQELFVLYPWHVLLPIALVVGQWAIIHYNGWFWPGVIESCMLVVLSIIMGAAWWCENGNSETVRLIKAKAAAKHRMICPLITFTDEPTSTNLEEDEEL